MKKDRPESCEFCERSVVLTFHHLVPKKMFKKRRVQEIFPSTDLHHYGIWLCGDCHKQLHRTLGHQDLAFNYNTKEALLSHPKIEKFVDWVRNQDKKVKR